MIEPHKSLDGDEFDKLNIVNNKLPSLLDARFV